MCSDVDIECRITPAACFEVKLIVTLTLKHSGYNISPVDSLRAAETGLPTAVL